MHGQVGSMEYWRSDLGSCRLVLLFGDDVLRGGFSGIFPKLGVGVAETGAVG
jgi:hypothetical protein